VIAAHGHMSEHVLTYAGCGRGGAGRSLRGQRRHISPTDEQKRKDGTINLRLHSPLCREDQVCRTKPNAFQPERRAAVLSLVAIGAQGLYAEPSHLVFIIAASSRTVGEGVGVPVGAVGSGVRAGVGKSVRKAVGACVAGISHEWLRELVEPMTIHISRREALRIQGPV
jgi:hypothetical protein